ncbi:MAG: hypothetical protein FWG70_09195 [Oscillospiraceae bacterium]|nr:hypothetical protein [Oscillospiraceae bacterium]
MGKAKEIALKFLNSIKEKWSSANKNARVITVALAAAMLVAVITLVALSNRTEYGVLYSGVSNEEMSQITAALSAMGIEDVKISGGTVSVPRELEDRARVQLSMEGFPKAAFNYDIWNERLNMFSTDADRREIQKQQLEQNLRATLMAFNDVQDALVIITPPDNGSYVLPVDRMKSQATVVLTTRQTLSARQIEGIYRTVEKAVPELPPENISITNQDGFILIAEEEGSPELALALERQKYNMQMEMKKHYEQSMEASVISLLQGTVRDFRVGVNAELDFSDWQEQNTRYDGANTDPETGMKSGMIDYQEALIAWNAIDADGNYVGVPIDADISPDYPTLPAGIGSEAYYENSRRTQYKNDEFHRTAQSNGFSIKNLSVAVQIDGGAVPQDETDLWEALIANGLGIEADKVTVKHTNFILEPPAPQITVPAPSPVRNLLVFIIISLGAILIILFMLAIMSSGSKKRRLIRARAAAYQGAGAASGYDDMSLGEYAPSKLLEDDVDEIKIQSLLGAGEGETREALLKNEIREFAKTNPDIVAQLIRTWIREG